MKKIVLTLAVILMMTTSALADTTGACGQNATWALNEATEILTISGTGPLYDYGSNKSPFYGNMQIKQIIINQGITTIGDFLFESCANLESVSIPNSVTRIGREAFSGCKNLTTVVIPNSVTAIDRGAFYACI